MKVHETSSVAAPFASDKIQFEKWGINTLDMSSKIQDIRPVDIPVDT
jgi:hypothetical protein